MFNEHECEMHCNSFTWTQRQVETTSDRDKVDTT